MPLQNRVLPDGSIVAVPERGTMMGNRGGCFHRADRTLKARHWVTDQWICCELNFKQRRRRVMAPDRYTELFFLDEATALAAGHRPCFECRRKDAQRFQAVFQDVQGARVAPMAGEMDQILHRERLDARSSRQIPLAQRTSLPDGVILSVVAADQRSFVLRWRGADVTWTPGGYRPQPTGSSGRDAQLHVLTSPTIVAVLAAGYRPRIHPSAEPIA